MIGYNMGTMTVWQKWFHVIVRTNKGKQSKFKDDHLRVKRLRNNAGFLKGLSSILILKSQGVNQVLKPLRNSLESSKGL